MKKRVFKYFFLIIITFLISILIYNYVESFDPIHTDEDILRLKLAKSSLGERRTGYGK